MFPFQILEKHIPNASQSNYSNQSNSTNAESKASNVCKAIANSIVRSKVKDEYVNLNELRIPKEALFIGGIFLARTLMYSLFRSASKQGIDISEL